MPKFITDGKRPNVISNYIWANQGQALFGNAPTNSNIDSGPLTSVQCLAVADDVKEPKTMTIYLTVNTQFKSINASGTNQVEIKDCEIKISRSFDLSEIHANKDHYSKLHALSSVFVREVLKHAQFALFKELGGANALPLKVYESLIFNPKNIDMKINETKVRLTPFIHYYQILPIPRINLIDQFIELTAQGGEMGFTTSAMRFCLSEPPCLDVLNLYKANAIKVFDLNTSAVAQDYGKVEIALQEMFKSVLCDLTMNKNNRNSHEYELFRDLLHRNYFNVSALNQVKPTELCISDLLDQAEYTEMDFSFTDKSLDTIEFGANKQHFYDNLHSFKETLGQIESAVKTCCHAYST